MKASMSAIGVLLAAGLVWGQASTPAAAAKAKPAAAKTLTTTETPAEGMPGTQAARKRDPFINPVQAVREGMAGGCSGGERRPVVQENVFSGGGEAVDGKIAGVGDLGER